MRRRPVRHGRVGVGGTYIRGGSPCWSSGCGPRRPLPTGCRATGLCSPGTAGCCSRLRCLRSECLQDEIRVLSEALNWIQIEKKIDSLTSTQDYEPWELHVYSTTNPCTQSSTQLNHPSYPCIHPNPTIYSFNQLNPSLNPTIHPMIEPNPSRHPTQSTCSPNLSLYPTKERAG